MIKEDVKCKRCGITLPANADVCPSCGLLIYSMPLSPENPAKNTLRRDDWRTYVNRDPIQKNDYLVTCPMCSNPISPNAYVCPHCGETLKKKTVPAITLIAALVLACIVIFFLFYITGGFSMFN